MRRFVRDAALVLLVLAVVGLLVAVSGVVPIKASSGHWAVTRWFLQFSKRRSVWTHTLGGPPLKLEGRALVLKGAGHYETGCAPCHGSPERRFFASAMQAMTPRPPYLPERISEWAPDELAYIVRHGIKFTGMPAWPAPERVDEVHAMVAFMVQLPSLGGAEYWELAYGPALEVPPQAATLPAEARNCARCHGWDGLGRGEGAFPKLAGQRRRYLEDALRAFARGERSSGIMQPVARGLSSSDLERLASYYSGLGGGPSVGALDPDAVARGERIATHGVPVQGVPSCADCHGPGPGRNAAYPELAGQYADYLVLQLELFKQERRGGGPFAHLMRHVAGRLTDAQMQDVATYYAAQVPER